MDETIGAADEKKMMIRGSGDEPNHWESPPHKDDFRKIDDESTKSE
ncbi:MAG: hypothetical protein ACFNOM_03975 [Parascardovia denticolens]|nr:hypothetical protein [Parascardovia denticolens]